MTTISSAPKLEVVRLDPNMKTLRTDSGNPIKAGQTINLVADNTRFFATKFTGGEVSGHGGVAPAGQHLFVRTRASDSFQEVTGSGFGTKPVPAACEWTGFAFHDETGPAAITIPDDADRLEAYVKFDRFPFDDSRQEAEDVWSIHVAPGEASPGYVSDFGQNFSIPVEKK